MPVQFACRTELAGKTVAMRFRKILSPALVLGLTGHIWTVLEYIRYPTHISQLQRQLWAEQRKDALESALEKYQRKKSLPTS